MAELSFPEILRIAFKAGHRGPDHLVIKKLRAWLSQPGEETSGYASP
jgi:hypothetical protein